MLSYDFTQSTMITLVKINGDADEHVSTYHYACGMRPPNSKLTSVCELETHVPLTQEYLPRLEVAYRLLFHFYPIR